MPSSALSNDEVALQIVAPDTSGIIGDASGASQRVMGRELAYYESRVGEDWKPEIVQTLMQWIQIAAVYLEIMTEATERYRLTLRKNTIINLVFSTVASTASLSTFNVNETSNPTTALLLKGFFSFFTIILTLSTGYIKVFQIQEKLETAIRLKQEWAIFGSKISSEMQLPSQLRKNAIWLIVKMKDNYLDLIKSDMGVSKEIIRSTALQAGLRERDLRLSQLFTRVIKNEVLRLNGDIEFDDDCEGDDCKEVVVDDDDDGFLSFFKFGSKKPGKSAKKTRTQELEKRLEDLGQQLEALMAAQTKVQVAGTGLAPIVEPISSGAPLLKRAPSNGSLITATPMSIVSGHVGRRPSTTAGLVGSARGSEEGDTSSRRRRVTRVSSYIMKPMSPSVTVPRRGSLEGGGQIVQPPPPPPPSLAQEYDRRQALLEELGRVTAANRDLRENMSNLEQRVEALSSSSVAVQMTPPQPAMNETPQEQLERRMKDQIRDMERLGIRRGSVCLCEMCEGSVVGGHCVNCGYVPHVPGGGTISPLTEDMDSRSVGSVLSRIPENESVGSGGEYKR
jgi:hypothetical protein